jgi:hypothetical protein
MSKILRYTLATLVLLFAAISFTGCEGAVSAAKNPATKNVYPAFGDVAGTVKVTATNKKNDYNGNGSDLSRLGFSPGSWWMKDNGDMPRFEVNLVDTAGKKLFEDFEKIASMDTLVSNDDGMVVVRDGHYQAYNFSLAKNNFLGISRNLHPLGVFSRSKAWLMIPEYYLSGTSKYPEMLVVFSSGNSSKQVAVRLELPSKAERLRASDEYGARINNETITGTFSEEKEASYWIVK